ncbi:peptide/nickel transport system permease protein [Lachnospiraceae bacterium NK3A20]|nr:peptide/nickel transport system permease protein [Lachnospiraceae bacterium NK3A20]
MRYLIRKAVILILTMFLISLMTFLAFHIIPGDPAQLILGTSASAEKLELLRHQLGTDLPLWQQYTSWIFGFFRGDFGTSIRYSMPVKTLLGDRIVVTALLGLMVIVLTLVVSIPLGVYAASRRNTAAEQVVNFLTMIGISIPGFFLSIIFMWVFGLVLHLFTPGSYVSYQQDFGAFLRFMIFPALAIAVPEIAILTKYIRTAMLDEMDKDYVRTARGKGASHRTILYGHILRNAIVAVIPLIGMMIGSIFSGSIIVEQVFGVPGIGRLLISSVTGRDFPLTQTLVMYIALIIVITNFIVDILIQVIDPRIRLSN